MDRSSRARDRRSIRTTARWLLGAALAAAATSGAARAQESPLQTLVQLRIDGDLSGVCLAAVRIAPGTGGLAADSVTRCAGSVRSLPARPAYRFDIGAVSKVFAGVVLAEMIERREVTLDDPLQTYLPAGITAPMLDGRGITLRDLVTHTAELPNLPPRLRPVQPRNPYATADSASVHGSLADIRLEQAPGARFRDSNWGFMLLSDALGRRAGKPYDALLRERVLAPLGMNDTVVGGVSGVLPGLLPGHLPSGRVIPAWDFPAAYAGAGGLRSTAADMAKFARALLGEIPASAPVTLRVALANAPKKLRDANRNVAIGMAWHRVRLGEREYVLHHADNGGFSSSLVVDPTDRTAAIVLADAAGGFEDLALRMIDAGVPLAAPRRAMALDATAARTLAGRYELRPALVLEVTLADGRLYVQSTGQPRVELLPDSRGDFHAAELDALLRVTRETDGKVSGVSLFQDGGVVHGRRLDD